VSLRWREEVEVLVTPQHVAVRRYARGAGTRVVHAADAAPGSPGFDWQPALEALDALLPPAAVRGAAATFVVSSHFVRHAVVPASDVLATHDDVLRYAQQNFVRVHGAAAERFSVRVSADAGGGLASGIEQALVDALHARACAHGLRPRALQPALMAAVNRARDALPAGACRIVVVEPGIATVALWRQGWRRVRCQRLDATPAESLVRLLERESVLDDGSVPATVVVPLTALDPPLQTPSDVRVLPALWPARTAAALAEAA
jgi:hypothetical protein